MRTWFPIFLAFLAGTWTWSALGHPPPVSAAAPGDFVHAVDRADPSVVHVTTVLEGERPRQSRDDAVGAGFVLSGDGLIVTSRHVLRAAQQIRVSIRGRGTFPAQVVGQDEVTDVAVLRIPVTGLTPATFGSPRDLKVGQWVLAAGSPYHLAHSWSVGIVSGLGRSQVGVSLRGYEDYIQTDAAANLGNSGGPLFDAEGRVVGMVTAILSRTGQNQGVTLAVPSDVVRNVATRLGGGRAVERPSLGVVVRETDTRGVGQAGLEITRFHPGSAARDAGLQVGDRIVAVGGTATVRTADLQRAVWAASPGSALRVQVVRGGRTFAVDLRPR